MTTLHDSAEFDTATESRGQIVRTNLLLLVAFAMLVLAACGGGAGTEVPPTEPTPLVVVSGSITQMPIAGLTYETPTQSGVIDTSGSFSFVAGETVTLKLGGTVLATFTAQEEVTFTDWMTDTLPLTNNAVARTLEGPDEPGTYFLNLATLLLTLDEDGSCLNGIQIPTRVLELLQGVDLGVNKTWSDFYQGAPLRTLLRDALAEGVWGGVGRAVIHPMHALDEVYAKLGINSRFERLESSRHDSDGDTTWDSAWSYTYAPSNLSSVAVTDLGADSVDDSRRETVFDALGYVTRTNTDSDADGTTDTHRVYTLSPAGFSWDPPSTLARPKSKRLW